MPVARPLSSSSLFVASKLFFLSFDDYKWQILKRCITAELAIIFVVGIEVKVAVIGLVDRALKHFSICKCLAMPADIVFSANDRLNMY